MKTTAKSKDRNDRVEVKEAKRSSAMKKLTDGVYEIKKSYLKWRNPKTKALVGYYRALELHLTTREDVECGIENPETHKLLGFKKAKAFGLLPDHMLRLS